MACVPGIATITITPKKVVTPAVNAKESIVTKYCASRDFLGAFLFYYARIPQGFLSPSFVFNYGGQAGDDLSDDLYAKAPQERRRKL